MVLGAEQGVMINLTGLLLIYYVLILCLMGVLHLCTTCVSCAFPLALFLLFVFSCSCLLLFYHFFSFYHFLDDCLFSSEREKERIWI